MNAENSTSLSLCVAMALPSQTGGGAACRGPTSPAETAVAGLPAGYADCVKGLTLQKLKIYNIRTEKECLATYSCDVPGCNPGCQNCWKNKLVIKTR